jgi:hypothetical protein
MMSLSTVFDSVLLNQIWHLEGWSLSLLTWLLPAVASVGLFALLAQAVAYSKPWLQSSHGLIGMNVTMFQQLWYTNNHQTPTKKDYEALHSSLKTSFNTDALTEATTVTLLMLAICRQLSLRQLHWNNTLLIHMHERLSLLNTELNEQLPSTHITALLLADVLTYQPQQPEQPLQQAF